MGDGTKENPYTSDDVIKAIEENGGKAEGLTPSGKWFERRIDLNELDLKGINLMHTHLERARLEYAHLEGAYLIDAYLEGANLRGAHLEGADLRSVDLRGTNLAGAHLKGAYLWSAKFPSIDFENVDWGDYILGDERDLREAKGEDREECLSMWEVDNPYRRLKMWHTNAGMYDVAGKFFYREMEAKRKARSWKKKPHLKLWSWGMRLLCGYGEKWEKVVVSAAAVILVLTLIYFVIGSEWEWGALGKSLYFSAVSFTAVGYGGWVNETWIDISNNWIKGIGVFESFIGVFMMALFLVTFTRKMTR